MKTPKKSKKKYLVDDPDEISFKSTQLSPKERAKADQELKRFRKIAEAKMTPKDKVMARLLQIRFLMEDAIRDLMLLEILEKDSQKIHKR